MKILLAVTIAAQIAAIVTLRPTPAAPTIEDRRDPITAWLDGEYAACIAGGGRLVFPFGCR